MNILVACEESQVVCSAFRQAGHKAWSCDIEECSGGHPEWHLKTDLENVLSLNLDWDMIIAFPPCTHLAVSGAKHWKKKQEDGRQQKAIDFFMRIAEYDCEKIVIENPVGIMSRVWRKPDQIINPWQFGHSVNKKTCLWLKGVDPLTPTNIVAMDDQIVFPSGKKMNRWYYETSCLPKDERAKARSKTFDGIAKAMAEQWG